MATFKLGFNKGHTWTKRDGSIIRVKNMTDQHVLNTYYMLEHLCLKRFSIKLVYFLTFFEDEIKRRGLEI